MSRCFCAARAQVDALEHEGAQVEHRAADLVRLDDVSRLGRGLDDVVNEPVDPARAGLPQELDLFLRQVSVRQEAGAQGVVDVVVDVGDAVDEADDLPLERGRVAGAGVLEDAVAHLLGEVQTAALLLEHVDHAERLLVVAEPAAEALEDDLVEHLLAGVAEGRVAQVVADGDRLGEILVEAERPRHRA